MSSAKSWVQQIHHQKNSTLWQTNIAGWKITIFNRKYIFKGSISHCYVSLPECKLPTKKKLQPRCTGTTVGKKSFPGPPGLYQNPHKTGILVQFFNQGVLTSIPPRKTKETLVNSYYPSTQDIFVRCFLDRSWLKNAWNSIEIPSNSMLTTIDYTPNTNHTTAQLLLMDKILHHQSWWLSHYS